MRKMDYMNIYDLSYQDDNSNNINTNNGSNKNSLSTSSHVMNSSDSGSSSCSLISSNSSCNNNNINDFHPMQISISSSSSHNNNDDHQFKQQQHEQRRENLLRYHVIIVSISYMLTMGMSGLVLCAIGSNVNDIAMQIGATNATILGISIIIIIIIPIIIISIIPSIIILIIIIIIPIITIIIILIIIMIIIPIITYIGGEIFLCRGIGTIIGTLSSSYLFQVFRGEHILIFGLIGIFSMLSLIPYSTSTIHLYIYFFILGLCSSTNDIGVNILTRKLHDKQAGPWLGANGIVFGMSAGIVPLIELITNNFETQYHILAGVTIFIACLLIYCINKRINGELLVDSIVRTESLSFILLDNCNNGVNDDVHCNDGSSSSNSGGIGNVSPNKSLSSPSNNLINVVVMDDTDNCDNDQVDNNKSSSKSQTPTTTSSTSSSSLTTTSLATSQMIIPNYYVESIIAWIVFFFIGGQVSFNAFIKIYLDEVHLIADNAINNYNNNKGGHVLGIFWFFVGIGRIIGVLDQRYLTDDNLIQHIILCCTIGTSALLLIALLPENIFIFWIGVIFYALFFGPCLSYAYDLNNRLTLRTDQSTIIVMRGVNMGASLVPYISGYIWDAMKKDPSTLMIMMAISMFIPLILVFYIQNIKDKIEERIFHADTLRRYFV